jgi:putative phosphoribosyl transferase
VKVFTDRFEAGLQLAQRLEAAFGSDVVVLAVPQGGVPVAFEIAQRLHAPLDVALVRRLGVPSHPSVFFGAIGEGGVRVVNHAVVKQWHLDDDEMATVEDHQLTRLRRRAKQLRRGDEPLPLAGRIAVVVDDGIATGMTARAACRSARARGAAKVVVAVPVAPSDVESRLAGHADAVLCLDRSAGSVSVRREFRHFPAVSDAEVMTLLERAKRRVGAVAAQAAPAVPAAPLRDEEVWVRAGNVAVAGQLTVPVDPSGVVVFAHGSGSSRHSPRNRLVAQALNRAGLATLMFDLLTPEEERNRANVFDIELLAGRLVAATQWLAEQPDTASLPVGYFGASTGAGAALVAAADPGVSVRAVVSRGGRPDLADQALPSVVAPTLLIVGGRDHVVLDLNRRAREAISGPCEIVVVPGATHVFEEPGTLDEVAELARDWFVDHLSSVSAGGTTPSNR